MFKKLLMIISICMICITGTITSNIKVVYADDGSTIKDTTKIGALFYTYMVASGINFINNIGEVADNLGIWLSTTFATLYASVALKINNMRSLNGNVILDSDALQLFNEGIDALNITSDSPFSETIDLSTYLLNPTFRVNKGDTNTTPNFELTYDNGYYDFVNFNPILSSMIYSSGYVYPIYYIFPKGTTIRVSELFNNTSTGDCYWDNWYYFSTSNLDTFNDKISSIIGYTFTWSGNPSLSQLYTTDRILNEDYNAVFLCSRFSFKGPNNDRKAINGQIGQLIINGVTMPITNILDLNGVAGSIDKSDDDRPTIITIGGATYGNDTYWDDVLNPGAGDISKGYEDEADDDDTDDEPIIVPYPGVLDDDLDDESSINTGGGIKFGIISAIAQLLANIFAFMQSIGNTLSNIWNKIKNLSFVDILQAILNAVTSIYDFIVDVLTGIKNAVLSIYDILTRTYTIDEINAISWINAVSNFETTITNAINNIKSYYYNNIGFFLNNISHPASNPLSAMVNTILVDSNLYWALYAIMTFSVLRWFL